MSTKAPSRRDTPASASPPEPTLRQGTEDENVAGFIGNAVSGEQPTTDLAPRSVLEQISERLPLQTHPEIIARKDTMSILCEDKAALVSILMEHGAPPDQPELNENDPAAVPARKNRQKEIFNEIVDGLFAATAAEMIGERRKGWELSRARQCFRDSHERGWMLFAERYGKVRGVVYKTVNRWLLNYEQEVAAPNPPLPVIAEVTAQGYDLTNKKYKSLLNKLRRIPRELAEVKPKETVELARGRGKGRQTEGIVSKGSTAPESVQHGPPSLGRCSRKRGSRSRVGCIWDGTTCLGLHGCFADHHRTPATSGRAERRGSGSRTAGSECGA